MPEHPRLLCREVGDPYVLYGMLNLCALVVGWLACCLRGVGSGKTHAGAHQPHDDAATHQSDGEVRPGLNHQP